MKTKQTKTSHLDPSWITRFHWDGSFAVDMSNRISVYVQLGIASVYYLGNLVRENDISTMSPSEFNTWLQCIAK